MTDVNTMSVGLKKKSDRMFVLVCFNFGMLLILFCALMFLTWKSVALVNDIEAKLQNAERSLAELRSRMQSLDAEAVMVRVTERTTERLKEAVQSAIKQSDLAPLNDLSGRITDAQQSLSASVDAIRDISESLQGMDADQLAQSVSYHILKGLGDGFTRAAEERKPSD